MQAYLRGNWPTEGEHFKDWAFGEIGVKLWNHQVLLSFGWFVDLRLHTCTCFEIFSTVMSNLMVMWMDSLCGQPLTLFCIYVRVYVCVCFVRTGPGPAARGAWKDSPRDLDERTTRHQYGHSEPQQILLTHNQTAGSQSDVTIKGEWKINRWRKKKHWI